MAKPKVKSEPILFATPPDPNRCFVLFSKICHDAGTAAVGLRSLASQLDKHPRDRPIKNMRYDAATMRLEIEFETEGKQP
ncbi:hypothetical protein [Paenibacillus tyrfis]|uniref:Uncharacterized protein n=1 Tax=Paenibacillus tyrfis TaxID=1501230 RepID=A0A081NY90_9BACL|nr:hypothetical protein [Paenibacillus tyrfis]KEQ23413.1 hypothetical protein ET33_16405 [Paenibacillus tyrfis]